MQVPLRPFLFFALLTTGACRNCETCNGTGNTCTGETRSCSKDEKICIVAYGEIVINGKTEQYALKGCDTYDLCNNPTIQFTVGGKTSYRAGVACCTESPCEKVPELPRKSTKPNGVTCPACFTEDKQCGDETVTCSGLESFCFDVIAALIDDGKETTRIMKGCTTHTVCAAIETGRSPMLDYDIVRKAVCNPTVSRGFLSTGLLLPLFSGLLLLKILL